MNIDIGFRPAVQYELSQAVLLYQGNRDVVAVKHDIQVKAGAARLMEGTLVTASVASALLEICDSSPLTYVPPNIVGVGRDAVAWFEPSSNRTMFFEPASDSAVKPFDATIIPQPPLLFVARRRSLRVYALADNERPTFTTELCTAPYWNVFDDGRVCTGSMEHPKAVDPITVQTWTTAFFKSSFTHQSSGGKRWKRPGTYAELLANARTAGVFHPEWLQRTKVTVEDAICGN